MTNPTNFKELLYRGLIAIQRYESLESKKFLQTIKQELGTAIGKRTSTIDYYLKGHVPTTLSILERLAQELLTRGHMDREWLEAFLDAGGYPDVASLCDELLVPSQGNLDDFQGIPYKRLRWHYARELFWDGITTSHTQIDIKVTSDSPLQSVRHRNTLDMDEYYEPTFLQFEPGFRDGNGSMEAHIMRNDIHELIWTVEFAPPLLKNERAFYSFTQRKQFTSLLTYESCYHHYQTGRFRGFFAYLRYIMPVPTDELYLKYTFPPEYQLALPPSGGFGVYLGFSENLEEKTRIVANNGFSANFDEATMQWTLELLVHNAKMGHYYELQWIPPRAELIEKFKNYHL